MIPESTGPEPELIKMVYTTGTGGSGGVGKGSLPSNNMVRSSKAQIVSLDGFRILNVEGVGSVSVIDGLRSTKQFVLLSKTRRS